MREREEGHLTDNQQAPKRESCVDDRRLSRRWRLFWAKHKERGTLVL